MDRYLQFVAEERCWAGVTHSGRDVGQKNLKFSIGWKDFVNDVLPVTRFQVVEVIGGPK